MTKKQAKDKEETMTGISPLSEQRKSITFTLGGQTFQVSAMSEKENARYQEQKRIDEQKRKQDALQRLKLNSLMDKQFYQASFATANISSELAPYYRLGKKYVKQWKDMKKNNMGLIFYGLPGTGKSHLSFCIANALLEQYVPLIATSVNALIAKLKEVSKFGTEEEILFWQRIGRADLLVLDDLGAEYTNDWANAKMYEIIDARYRSKLPIIITTNLTPNVLKQRLTYGGIPRTFDRIMEMCSPIEIKANPLRQQKGKEKMARLKRMMEEP